jgi:transposase
LRALHRVRERLVSQRTAILNQIHAFLLERAVVVRQGLRFLRLGLPIILATRSDVLSPRILRLIEGLASDWRRPDERIDGLSQEIQAPARQDPACERLMTVPGIGPVISSNGSSDRQWCGVHEGTRLRRLARTGAKQISTGDRTLRGAISRRGNRYFRTLFVRAAWMVLVRIKDRGRYGLKAWIDDAKRECATMCWRSRWPTSLPALRGRFSTSSAPSNA